MVAEDRNPPQAVEQLMANLLSEDMKYVLGRFKLGGPGFDLRDDAAWDEYLSSRLSPGQAAYLHRAFHQSSANFLPRPGVDGREEWNRTLAFRNWCLRVLSITVDLKPAARAILRDAEKDYRVELQWVMDRRAKAREDRQVLKTVTIVADDGLRLSVLPNLELHMAAFFVRVLGPDVPGAFVRAPRQRPAPGQPPDPNFYQRLLEVYNRLEADGFRDPARELARRMDANHSTVKSWLRRGRQYAEQNRWEQETR